MPRKKKKQVKPEKIISAIYCRVSTYDQTVLDFSSLDAQEQALRDWCKDRISRWKIPRYIFFVDSFPITLSGKIQKYKLQKQYIKDLNLN